MTSGQSLIGRIISFFSRSKIQHVGVFFWEGKRLKVVEASFFGIREMPFSNLLTGRFKIYCGKIPKEVMRFSEEQIKERIFSKGKDIPKIGSKYDLLGALFSILWDTKSKQAYCSEYASILLNLKFSMQCRGTVPNDFAILCGDNIFEIKK